MTNPYIWNSPIKLSLAGGWRGSLEEVGSGVNYWSSVGAGHYFAHYLRADSDGIVDPGIDYYRSYGSSVRCVARKPNYMQDVSTWESTLQTGEETTAEDKRDGKKYKVAKLADGNIWMTQNLDHDIKTDGSVTYDNTTTDLGWNGTGYDTASWTPSTATYSTGTTTWNGSDTAPESYDPGEQYWSGTIHDSTPVSTGSPYYHLGNYYNWTAAVAMNDSSSYTNDNTDVNQSICPAGWTLPKSGNNTSSGSFKYLVEKYGWSDNQMTNPYIWNSPIKLPLAGFWHNSSQYDVGGDGYYWSSVVGGSSRARFLWVEDDGTVAPTSYTLRSNGSSVRCVAR